MWGGGGGGGGWTFPGTTQSVICVCFNGLVKKSLKNFVCKLAYMKKRMCSHLFPNWSESCKIDNNNFGIILKLKQSGQKIWEYVEWYVQCVGFRPELILVSVA